MSTATQIKLSTHTQNDSKCTSPYYDSSISFHIKRAKTVNKNIEGRKSGRSLMRSLSPRGMNMQRVEGGKCWWTPQKQEGRREKRHEFTVWNPAGCSRSCSRRMDNTPAGSGSGRGCPSQSEEHKSFHSVWENDLVTSATWTLHVLINPVLKKTA